MNAILVTGGTGKTGRYLTRRLLADKHAVRIATRSTGTRRTVAFDWGDPTTYGPALDGTSAVYLVAPSRTLDMLSAMEPFLELAMRDPARRLVLLSALAVELGGVMMGAVHEYLAANAARWVVLRPSWFQQNFSETLHLTSIREHGIIRTAAGSGRTGFVHADDIAAVAAAALTQNIPNGVKIPTGPAALTYDDAAETIAQAIGRPVRHESVGEAALAREFEAHGIEQGYARVLAKLNAGIASGTEDIVTHDVRDAAGRAPISLAAFAEDERDVWTKA